MITRDQYQVLLFRRALGLPIGNFSEPAVGADGPLHVALLAEEVAEFAAAIAAGDLVEAADALADIQYILLGAATDFGIDIGQIFDEVHESNMRKASAPRDAKGKIGKPPGWTPPDVAGCLERQRSGD
jgi:predicted HAD superfamily Cof-like phosphohydrolase